MNELRLQPGTSTPRVHFPASGGVAWIEGACYPEDAFTFFRPIFQWVEDFRKSPQRQLELNLKLDYFNTSSSKCLLDLFLNLQDCKAEGGDVEVRWHYCEDDPDLRESGEELGDGLRIPFELVAY